MRILLDTHAFLWGIGDPAQLSTDAKRIISDRNNQIFLSVASGWEIAIKASIGKLSVPANLESFMLEQIRRVGIEILSIQMSHALRVYKLPNHHQDPFDRMLVAQSQLENLPIVTNDPQIARYSVKTIW